MTDHEQPNPSQVYAEDLSKYPIMKLLWEILRFAYQREDGGMITLTYIREDFEPGYDLMLSHRVAGRGETWPYVTCVRADDYSVTLRMGFSEDQMQEITVDETHPEVEVPFTTPAGEKGTITLYFEGDTLEMTEWDTWSDTEMIFHLYVNEYVRSFEDAATAYQIGLQVAEQTPDTVEIAMLYMYKAAKLGSTEAEEWIEAHEYDPEPGDGRWDAYV